MKRVQPRLQKSAMFALLAVLSLLVAACGDSTATLAPAATTAATATTAAAAKSTAAATGQSANLDQLIAAAKQEGSLTTIALPHDWCGYGDLIANFKQKYGLQVNELNPDGSSGDEIEAIKANTQNKGPQAPDVIDVGLSFGPQTKEAKLIQPYKVSNLVDYS